MKKPTRKASEPTPAQIEILEDLKIQGTAGGFVNGQHQKHFLRREWIEPIGGVVGKGRFRITPAGIEALPKPRVRTAGEELTRLQSTYSGNLLARGRGAA